MSLILDALRRAESERERGSVPKLSSLPVPPPSAEAPPPSALGPWHWMAIGVGLALLIVLGAYIFGRQAAQQEAVAAALSRAPAAPDAASAPLPPEATAPLATPAPAPASLPVAEPAPWPASERKPEARRPSPKAAATGAAPPAAITKVGPPAAPAPAPAEPPVYTREQLPAGVRAQLPSIRFGGSMYSANPAHRSLIINGLIYREKDAVATGLWLEQIRAKGAVFRFGEYRFEVPY